MARQSLPGVLKHLRRLAEQPESDRRLLERFAARRDEAAFAALLNRHGPMVWGVCLRILQNATDAEDAFQATFLVLARKAAAQNWHDSVGGWLHAVAQRVALKARTAGANAARAQRLGQRETDAMPDADALAGAAQKELRAVLDEELAHLPEKYRAPLVLCYLEGRTNEEAAAQLGWTKGTVSGRISRARDILRQRLARRGLALSAATLTVALSASTASAGLPAALVDATLQAAALDSAAAAALGVVSARAVALAERVLRAAFVRKLNLLGLALIGLLAAAAGIAWQTWAADPNETPLAPLAGDPRKPAFVRAEVTLHLGRDGVADEPQQDLTQMIDDPAALAPLLAFFPEIGSDARTNVTGGWRPRVTAKFINDEGACSTVRSSWTEWSDGAGDRKVKGNLLKHVGELFAVARLVDQGSFMDSWRVVAFEEGGKKRDVESSNLTVTPERFGMRVTTSTRRGISYDGRMEYQSPRAYRVDPSKSPRQLTMSDHQGIYAIEGDVLKICLDKSGRRRPTEFKTEPGNAYQILLILRRDSADGK
jgi:RNA polymerase sigma factor (sigma-70 family)